MSWSIIKVNIITLKVIIVFYVSVNLVRCVSSNELAFATDYILKQRISLVMVSRLQHLLLSSKRFDMADNRLPSIAREYLPLSYS